MKRMIAWWRNIPRSVRILSNLLLVVFLFFAVYLFRGCPSLTAEQAYRRAVAGEMVEPGEILGTVLGEPYIESRSTSLGDSFIQRNYHYKIIVAENSEGVMLYRYREEDIGSWGQSQNSFGDCSFSYREKGEYITLIVGELKWLPYETNYYIEFPVILFDDFPKAVRAELDLYMDAKNYDVEETYEYHLEAQRKQGGFFEFRITAGDGKSAVGKEAYALNNLQQVFNEWNIGGVDSYPAAVRLYDSRDELVYEEEMILQSHAAEVHAKNEKEGAGNEN